MSVSPSSRGLPLIGGGHFLSCELLKGYQYVAQARVVINHRLLSYIRLHAHSDPLKLLFKQPFVI